MVVMGLGGGEWCGYKGRGLESDCWLLLPGSSKIHRVSLRKLDQVSKS